MIVTVILSILALLAAGPLMKMRERAMVAAATAELRSAIKALEIYDAFNEQLPRALTDLDKLDWRESSDIMICRFAFSAGTSRRDDHVRIDLRHRGSTRGVTTRHPTWGGRIDEINLSTCADLRPAADKKKKK